MFKVLLLNQFFPPDSAPTGRFLADLAQHLLEQHYQVTVICGQSCYSGQPDLSAPASGVVHPGIRIIRVPGFPFAHGRITRVASWLSFFAGALFRGFSVAQPDVVLTLTTPPLLGLIGTLFRFRGARHIIWEMDLYPDVATTLGAIRSGSLLDRIIGAAADYSRRRADAVIALGPCMRRRLLERGIPAERVHITENWADGARIRPLSPHSDGCLKVLYSGNLGLAHDTETIAGAMLALAGCPQFHFTFAGAGPRRNALEEFCRTRGISNVTFEPYRDVAHLSEHLGSCDIGLVTQNPATLGCVVPSKTYALMAAGRPILFIGPRKSTPGLNIKRFRCGWQIDPGDVQGLTRLLRLLEGAPHLVRESGARAYNAFCHHYDLPQGVARITEILGTCTTARVSTD